MQLLHYVFLLVYPLEHSQHIKNHKSLKMLERPQRSTIRRVGHVLFSITTITHNNKEIPKTSLKTIWFSLWNLRIRICFPIYKKLTSMANYYLRILHNRGIP